VKKYIGENGKSQEKNSGLHEETGALYFDLLWKYEQAEIFIIYLKSIAA